jgi:glycosyltransferase involved in cell wall biosynthesis
MKILLLSDPNSTHTKKWVTALSQNNIDIALFGLGNYDKGLYKDLTGVKVYSGRAYIKSTGIGKLSYLKTTAFLKKVYSEFKPDIVHAHYATSYGLLGSKLKHHPYIISVWGSDVYDFPNRSLFHKQILKRNLAKANIILSTSKVMAEETRKYTSTPITVTPFGIDTEVFKSSISNNEKLIIGTVKTLETNYGIDDLIKAFKIISDNNPKTKLELRIIGEGNQKESLKLLTKELNISEKVNFVGKVEHDKIPEVLNEFDIYVALSHFESFGVAILEASACEIPVVVSDAAGLKEVVINEKTGLIVEQKNATAAAEAIQKLIDNELLRKTYGQNGRKRVIEHYDWKKNVETMITVYKEIINLS